MRRAFTLIEILVSVSIVAIISGGALVNLNQYSSRQRLQKSVGEVNSALKLAQNYAKTRQLPIGSSETDLNYIRVSIEDGKYLVADANGVGSTYFHILVNTDEIEVGSTPAEIFFWPGSGRLVSDTNGTAYTSNEKATFYVRANSDITNYGKIEVSSLGQVNVVGIF